MSTETIECSHDVCRCRVTAVVDPEIGEATLAFCGEYCQANYDVYEEHACSCGHPPCDEP